MKNDLVAVLYFDDTQIVGRIAKVSYGQTLTPVTTVRKEYSGIMDSRFNDREDFTNTVNEVVAEWSTVLLGCHQFYTLVLQISFVKCKRNPVLYLLTG